MSILSWPLTLIIELMIFEFSKGGRKQDIDKLFIIPPNKLTPLVYINKNLFNNFTLFDPEITRSIRSSYMLPQMIGYVEIISDDEKIQFNSDRTQFQINELTESIKKTLADINKFIQKKGSEIKAAIKNENRNITKENAGEDHTDNPQYKPVVLEVQETIILYTDSGQVDLRQYILQAIDSCGQPIDKSQIEIRIDGKLHETGILESIEEECQKTVTYTYNDPHTKKAVAKSILKILNRPIDIKDKKPILIPNKGHSSYKYNFNFNTINNLICQLEKLYTVKGSYNEVIACSLRALFELCIFELETANIIKFNGSSSDKLTAKVCSLITAILRQDKLLGAIVKGLKRPDFTHFKNELTTTDFNKIVKMCHLGAHKSTYSITDSSIREIGQAAGLFLAITNELLNNNEIDWSSLGHPWELKITEVN